MQSREDCLPLFRVKWPLVAAGKRKVVELLEHAPLRREPGTPRTEAGAGHEPARAKGVQSPEDGPLEEDCVLNGRAERLRNERHPHLAELLLDDVPRGMLAPLALMGSPLREPGAEGLALALQCLGGQIPGRCRFPFVRVFGNVGYLVDFASPEVAALRKMVDGAADFMLRQRFAFERAPSEIVGIAHHGPTPVGRVAWRQESSGVQHVCEQPSTLSPPAQLTAAKARLPPFLVQRNAMRIAGFREDSHTEAEDCSRAEPGIVVDHGEPNRGRADVQTKCNWHECNSMLQSSRRTIVLTL